MKKILFLLLFSIRLFAQDPIVVSLKNQKILLPTGCFIEKIIDARVDSKSSDISMKQESGEYFSFEKTLEDELMSMILPNADTVNRLIVKIHQFYVKDINKKFGKYSHVEIKLSLIEKEKDGTYQELFVTTKVGRLNSLFWGNEKGYHDLNIARTFKDCFEDFYQKKEAQKLLL